MREKLLFLLSLLFTSANSSGMSVNERSGLPRHYYPGMSPDSARASLIIEEFNGRI